MDCSARASQLVFAVALSMGLVAARAVRRPNRPCSGRFDLRVPGGAARSARAAARRLGEALRALLVLPKPVADPEAAEPQARANGLLWAARCGRRAAERAPAAGLRGGSISGGPAAWSGHHAGGAAKVVGGSGELERERWAASRVPGRDATDGLELVECLPAATA